MSTDKAAVPSRAEHQHYALAEGSRDRPGGGEVSQFLRPPEASAVDELFEATLVAITVQTLDETIGGVVIAAVDELFEATSVDVGSCGFRAE